nr:VWA domain-containing protein [Chthoniobacterales bacterium]
MKNNYAEIAFVLDRSGSMDSCRDAAIEGFNRFLKEQQQVEGLARLTLVLFDDEYLVPI